MNYKKFKQCLDLLCTPDDNEVVVPTQGIGGPNVKVSSIHNGFDWYDGKLLITPEKSLSTISNTQYHKLEKLYLRKVSNINQIETSKTGEIITAKYKTKRFTGAKLESLQWLLACLEEDLKKANY